MSSFMFTSVETGGGLNGLRATFDKHSGDWSSEQASKTGLTQGVENERISEKDIRISDLLVGMFLRRYIPLTMITPLPRSYHGTHMIKNTIDIQRILKPSPFIITKMQCSSMRTTVSVAAELAPIYCALSLSAPAPHTISAPCIAPWTTRPFQTSLVPDRCRYSLLDMPVMVRASPVDTAIPVLSLRMSQLAPPVSHLLSHRSSPTYIAVQGIHPVSHNGQTPPGFPRSARHPRLADARVLNRYAERQF